MQLQKIVWLFNTAQEYNFGAVTASYWLLGFKRHSKVTAEKSTAGEAQAPISPLTAASFVQRAMQL